MMEAICFVWFLGGWLFFVVLIWEDISSKQLMFMVIFWPFTLLVYIIEGGIQFIQNIKK